MKRLLSALLIMILIIPGTISDYPLKAKAEAGSSGILAYYNDAGEIVYDLNGLEGLDKDFAMTLYLVLDDAWVRYLEDPSQYFRVIVPPGTYFINPDTKSIRLGSNVTLELNRVNIICDEDDVIIQTKTRPSNKRDGIYAEEGVGGYDDYQNIKIVGGTIDLNSNSRVPIRFAHVTGLTLENLTVKNSAATHMVEIAACRDVYVTGCTFMDSIKEDPENMPLEAFQIDAANRETMSYSKDPVYDDCPCDNVEVAYCTFKNLYRGFGSHTVIPDVYQSNIRVHDCSFIDIENAAIMCTMWKDSNIYDNEYINVGKETDDTEYEWYTHDPSYMQEAE
jgi:hypothetical protein